MGADRNNPDAVVRRDTLAAVPLATADRAVAALLRGRPVLPLQDESPGIHGLDAYTAAFLDQHGGIRLGHSGIDLLASDEVEHDPVDGAVCVAWWGEERAGLRPGNVGVFRRATDSEPSWPSVAHFVLAVELTLKALVSLGAKLDEWGPPFHHPDPLPRPRLPPPLTMRANVNAPLFVPTIAALGASVVALASFDGTHGDRWVGALVLAAGGWAAFFARWREVMVLVPRAQQLAPDDDGFVDPKSRERARWRTLRAATTRGAAIVLTREDGTEIVLPWRAFVDGPRAAREIARRVHRDRTGPYRS